MNYLKKLIDMHDSASSKIFVGLVFALVTILLIIGKVVIVTIPMELLYFVGGLTLSFFGLSSVDRFTKKQDGLDTTNEQQIIINKESQTT
jgi:uncharacterized membrane protein